LNVCPQAKIIHLVRNPLDCFHSMNSRRELDGDPIKIASTWVGYNACIRSFKKQLGDQYYLLKYEDLKADTEGELKKLCAWLDLPFDSNMLKDVKAYHGKNKGKAAFDSMSEDQQSLFSEIVKAECAHYQYHVA